MIKLTEKECRDSAKTTLKKYKKFFTIRHIYDVWQFNETSIRVIAMIHVHNKFQVLHEYDGEEWYEKFRLGKYKVVIDINYGYNKNRETGSWEFNHSIWVERYYGD